MPTAYFGTYAEPGFVLEQSDDLIAVRTRSGRSITLAVGPVPTPLSAELEDGTLVAAYPEVGVEVYRVPVGRAGRSVADRKTALRESPDVQFAGGVLVDPVSREPVLYTENVFVKFTDAADPDACVAVLREAGLTVKEEVSYAVNAYFAAAPEGIGQAVFEVAATLLQREDVEFCHPELIRAGARKKIFPQQWHLKKTTVRGVTVDAHANIEAAHAITRGTGVTIAIIDDGVDIDHPEFGGPGKVTAPRDATLQTHDPRPKRRDDNHGTACAGVACANGVNGACGTAPQSRLMPIRLVSGLGSQREADAFAWAADNGADVISCSWGPPDGQWWDPGDLLHQQVFPLPTNIRLAIDYAVANGRGGKGCVVLFASGNGNESVDNDGYAGYASVIAVAACNDRGVRSVYSDFGRAVWCAFPSNDLGYAPFEHPAPLTPGIWTTDRAGAIGYNTGNTAYGDAVGNFTNSFGGTSSSCPGAAGVAALMLSVNPDLKWREVKDLLKRACDKIDPQGGDYDASGHSPKYGYGRLNALTAVELAEPQPRSGIAIRRRFDAPIPDLRTSAFTLNVPDNTLVEALTVTVDLTHGHVGDLVIAVRPPAGIGSGGAVVLHNRGGGAARSLKRTYDATTTPALATFAGKGCAGTWTLLIRDAAPHNAGVLNSFALGLAFRHPGRYAQPSTPEPAAKKSKNDTTSHQWPV